MVKRVEIENIPAVLKAVNQWVCWQYMYRKGTAKGKPAKVPVSCKNGRPADITKSQSYCTFEEALAYVQLNCETVSGTGFVFTASDPFVGIDLDNCRDSQTGVIKEWAKQIIADLNSYSEVSPSGGGVKIFVKGKLPAKGRKSGDIEMYSDKRFFTVTGQRLDKISTAVEERSDELLSLHQSLFKSTAGQEMSLICESPEDRQLIERAMQAKSGGKFAKLWKGDTSGYPSDSEADLALCGMLCYWVDGEAERIEKLFSQSALGQRDKWANREDYRRRTVETAIRGSGREEAAELTTKSIQSIQKNQEDSGENQEELGSKHKVVVDGQGGDGPPPANVESQSLEMAQSLAEEVGQLPDWEAAFMLARRLHIIAREQPEQFAKAAKLFCVRTNRPFSDFWYAYLAAWDKVKLPEDEALLSYAIGIGKEKLADFEDTPYYHALVLAVASWYLAEFTKDRLFWLPRVELGELLGVCPKTITNLVEILEKRGIIRCESEDYSYKYKKCKVYRFTCPSPERTLLGKTPSLPLPLTKNCFLV